MEDTLSASMPKGFVDKGPDGNYFHMGHDTGSYNKCYILT